MCEESSAIFDENMKKKSEFQENSTFQKNMIIQVNNCRFWMKS